MPKKKPKAPKETAVVEEVKPSKVPKNVSNEIDEIFSGKKRKKPENGKADKENKNEGEKPKSAKKRKSKEDTEGQFIKSGSNRRRKTADGFTLYTEEELGISNANAGGTALCPFDCECCF